ncbi:hypothetical protein HGRIS_008243 [Hohenbuehelia grisea]|uniref:Guanine nucleotide-binding protein-like 1 n=1 Tax=Hohenbuehelia grisea TaxID=104357 RepID=A0ABR3J7S3_9AGAR
MTKLLRFPCKPQPCLDRGDVPPPEPKSVSHKRKPRPRVGPTGRLVASASSSSNVVESSRRLQSSFIKLSPAYLAQTKSLADNLLLERPIPLVSALLPEIDSPSRLGASPNASETLSCPKRPKWRYDMSKKELEANEEGLFKKWLQQTDDLVERWRNQTNTVEDPALEQESKTEMPRSMTFFERNLEVWRQLWRVSEISQIILVLLDSRCPLLHYPPSLQSYLSTRKVILVLTKVDISGPVRSDAWVRYLRAHLPDVRIVKVESYIEKSSIDQQGRKQFEPFLPEAFRDTLVKAIRDAHTELLDPPERVKANEARLSAWIPPVKRVIDWDAVLKAEGDNVGAAVGGATAPRPPTEEIEGEHDHDQPPPEDKEPTILTIGLIGQPNVGKSSLLNALFGARRVRASKTPGKTKHFQTLFWTNEVRLVDCPGLVMPNYVPMEMQVLSGVLPISRISAVPACVYYASQRLPLEEVFALKHPSLSEAPVEDKRTWRDGMKVSSGKQQRLGWTAMDILTAYANKKGWVTAKAGRPDVNRAGNAILRALAEGRVGWAFWPPGREFSQEHTQDDSGLWIPARGITDDDDEHHSSDDQREPAQEHEDLSDVDKELSDTDVESDPAVPVKAAGMFAALSMAEEAESEEDEDEDEESDEKS